MANDNPTGNGGGNGGIIKSVANVASKTVGALAGFPMLLVLTLLNVGTFAMLTWLLMQSAEYRYKERAELIQLLRNCVIQHLDKGGGASYKTPGWNGENTQKIDQQKQP